MDIQSDLDIMKYKWELLEIQEYFSSIHHFSSNKFQTKPPSLAGFYNWCKDREIKNENLQTLNRTFKSSRTHKSRTRNRYGNVISLV